MSHSDIYFSYFREALARLVEGLRHYTAHISLADDLMGDGIIKRFDFAFEFAWKTMKEILRGRGFDEDININSPKSVLMRAHELGLIEDQFIWLAMLKDSKEIDGLYSKKTAAEICDRIRHGYVPEFQNLENRLWNWV